MQNILLSIFFSCAIVLPFFIAHLLNARRIERDSKIWDKNKGHVVTAVLRKKEHRHHDTSKVGVYEYEHEGKAYRYHLWQNYLPETITLYFARNPKKADTEPELYAQKKPLRTLPHASRHGLKISSKSIRMHHAYSILCKVRQLYAQERAAIAKHAKTTAIILNAGENQ